MPDAPHTSFGGASATRRQQVATRRMHVAGGNDASQVYIYQVGADDGGSPCIRGDLMSLAIREPQLRMSAKRGDLILGFAAPALYPNRGLVHAVRITSVLERGRYFKDPEYAARPDCVYQWDGQRFALKSEARYHRNVAQSEEDLGEVPRYAMARTLLSDGVENFMYFGPGCPVEYRSEYPQLGSLVDQLDGPPSAGEDELRKSDPGRLAALQAEIPHLIERLWNMPWRNRETPLPAETLYAFDRPAPLFQFEC